MFTDKDGNKVSEAVYKVLVQSSDYCKEMETVTGADNNIIVRTSWNGSTFDTKVFTEDEESIISTRRNEDRSLSRSTHDFFVRTYKNMKAIYVVKDPLSAAYIYHNLKMANSVKAPGQIVSMRMV